ncbi:hypothetical protein CU098_012231, partial [Rhizopus stolonifer]
SSSSVCFVSAYLKYTATSGLKKAYKLSLVVKDKYAFEPEEAHFKMYAALVSALQKKKTVTSFSSTTLKKEPRKIVGVEGKFIVVQQVYDGLYATAKVCSLKLLVDGMDIEKTHTFLVCLFKVKATYSE